MTTSRRGHRAQWSAGAAGPVLAAVPDPEIGPLEDHDLPASALSWQDFGLCAEVDGDLWFPEKGGDTSAAKRICFACPVRVQCLDYALANGERFGIWGGFSERDRRRLRREAAA